MNKKTIAILTGAATLTIAAGTVIYKKVIKKPDVLDEFEDDCEEDFEPEENEEN